MSGNHFLEAMARSLGEQAMQEAQSSRPLDPDVQILRLIEAGVRYSEAKVGPRFRIGEIIRGLMDGPVQYPEAPRLVIDTRPAGYDFIGNPMDSSFGLRHDIRVLLLKGDSIFPYWDESAHYEAWPNKETGS